MKGHEIKKIRDLKHERKENLKRIKPESKTNLDWKIMFERMREKQETRKLDEQIREDN